MNRYLAALALIAASGFFSLFEAALKNTRIPRLKKEAADEGSQGKRRSQRYHRVLKAAENPSSYYAAVSIWICVLRVIAVITAISCPILPAALSAAALVIAILTAGDLVPMAIARSAPEKIAAGIFPLFLLFFQPLRPLFFLAQIAGKRLKPAFISEDSETGMTEDELRLALIEGEKSGIVESKERTMVEGVFYLGDRPLGAFMTHRSEIQWLDINESAEDIRAKVIEYRQQRCFPVAAGTLDEIIGAAYLEDVILDCASDTPAGLRGIMKTALVVPETMPALKAFESFRQGEAYFLFVMDEYGGFAGMVSLRALMEEIVGEIAAPAGEEERAVKQDDGTWVVSGSLHIDDAAELLSLPDLGDCGDYHTLAGFLLHLAGELPRTGNSFTYEGYRFTVLDMDGNRIDRIEIKKTINE